MVVFDRKKKRDTCEVFFVREGDHVTAGPVRITVGRTRANGTTSLVFLLPRGMRLERQALLGGD